MADYIPIDDSEVEPEAPLISSLGVRWRDNPIAIAQGASGAPRVERDALMYSWRLESSDTLDISQIRQDHPDWFLVAKLWGGGGAGAQGDPVNSNFSGAGGGGYAEIVVPISELPDSLSVTVGSGGQAQQTSDDQRGEEGGATYIEYDGNQVGAGGGGGGYHGTDSDAPVGRGGGGWLNGHVRRNLNVDGTESYRDLALPGATAWNGGSGAPGPDTYNTNGGDALLGGAGGGGCERESGSNITTDGGTSLQAGNGGDARGGDGEFPGGGGASHDYDGTAGNGGDGLAIIEIRSWR